MSDFRYFITANDGRSFEVMPLEGFVNVELDLDQVKLYHLAQRSSREPIEILKSVMEYFIDQDEYEEAAVIRDEINSRL